MLDMNNVQFDQDALLSTIAHASHEELDQLDFGVIGINETCLVQRYNIFESKLAGLRVQNVMGNNLFTNVAPCMNNFMVAQRFEDAQQQHMAMDDTINYVLTLRMRPIPVKLRLLSSPNVNMRFILVRRLS